MEVHFKPIHPAELDSHSAWFLYLYARMGEQWAVSAVTQLAEHDFSHAFYAMQAELEELHEKALVKVEPQLL